MILVSFSSAENALSNDVKYITLLARKVLKICRSAFFETPGIVPYFKDNVRLLWDELKEFMHYKRHCIQWNKKIRCMPQYIRMYDTA